MEVFGSYVYFEVIPTTVNPTTIVSTADEITTAVNTELPTENPTETPTENPTEEPIENPITENLTSKGTFVKFVIPFKRNNIRHNTI